MIADISPSSVTLLAAVAIGLAPPAGATLSPTQLEQLPPPAAVTVDFVRDIQPIFEASCVQCHARGKDKGGFSLETRTDFLLGGHNDDAAEPGNSAASLVVAMISGLDPEIVMPQKGKRLTAEQVGLVRAWIDQGLAWPDDVNFRKRDPANLRARELADLPVPTDFSHPVDGLIDTYFAQRGLTWPAPVDDRTFARRVWLDTIGLLPPAEQLDAFVQDQNPGKRTRLIERLLADDRSYADHWITFWNDLLRNDYKSIGAGGNKQITEWLYPALVDNLPYSQFVRELIDPVPGAEGFTRGIVWRGTVNASMQPPIQAAQNIAQVFLGVNLKCAACHDSFINEYTLADAYGLGAVYADGPLEIAECDKPTGQFGKVKFLYESLGSIDADATRKERMRQLADIITGRANGRLPRTIVNRFWQRFLGRGLVEPVDEMDQPAWAPNLLDWLAEDFVAHGQDLRHLIARILTSRAYQLPSVDDGEPASNDVFRGPTVRRLSAEQFVDAVVAVSGTSYPQSSAKVDRPVVLGRAAAAALPLAPQWIWSTADAARRTRAGSVTFSREFDLPAAPSEAFITLAADNAYDLRINGTQIGAESSRNLTPAARYDVREHLKAGANTITVIATNDPLDESSIASVEAREKFGTTDTSAGLIVYARIRSPDHVLDLVSDASWTATSDDDVAANAVPLGGLELETWNLDSRFLRLAASSPETAGIRRASLMVSDPLQVALGRPNREQVVTTRADQATTLQALELANGRTFAALLQKAAAQLAQDAPGDARSFGQHLYRRALGREPTAGELTLATELLGPAVEPAGIQDLLWVISMLPEFQLIH